MLLWAIFTLGFMFGVFVTLKVFVGKEEFKQPPVTDIAVNTASLKISDPWEKFTQLTKINYPRGSSNNNKATPLKTLQHQY